jgi:hypothetical protein
MINSGQTPAEDAFILSNICVADFPLPGELPDLIDDDLEGSRASIYPRQGPIPVVAKSAPITQEEKTRLLLRGPNGEPSITRFFLHGSIVYKDVFGRDIKKSFRCMTGGLSVNGAQFTWCREGNGEVCKDEEET